MDAKRITILFVALMFIAGCGGEKQEPASLAKAEANDQTPASDHHEGPSVYHAALGEIHLRYGFLEEAIAAFRTACVKEEDPREIAKFRFQLGRAYLELGKAEKAIREMEEAINASSSTDSKCDMYLELAKIYALQELWAGAEQAYRFVANSSKQGWQKDLARTELNLIHARTQRIDEVIASLERAIERNPWDDEARMRLAEIFTTAKPHLQRAIKIYESLHREGKLSPSLVERLASLYIRVGRLTPAQRTYEKLIEVGGEERRNRYRLALAQVHEKTNNPSRARELYNEVLEHDPIDWERELAKKRLYALYEREGVVEGIAASLEKKAIENPNDMEALAELSEIYATIEKHRQKAIEVTERLLLLKPGDSTVLKRLADLYEKNEQKGKSIDVLKSLLSVSPNGKGPAHLERIARLYSEMGKTDEALKWVKRLTTSESNSAGIHARAALLYLENSRMPDCLAEHKKAISLSTSAEQRDALRAQLAEQLFSLGDYSRAEGIYERLVESSVSGSLQESARERLAALHAIQEKGM
jgi:tetratricopeptide (TPR) repeat protein